jgi:hypothetical protein
MDRETTALEGRSRKIKKEFYVLTQLTVRCPYIWCYNVQWPFVPPT